MSPPLSVPPEVGGGRTLVSALWPPPSPERSITILRRDGTRDVRKHGDLLEEAGDWAEALAARGVSRGTPVGLVTGTDFDFILACLAIWRAGGIVVPLPQPSRKMSRETWKLTTATRFDAAKVGHFIGAKENLPAGVADVSCIAHDELRDADERGDLDDVLPTDRALIQFTSGSTAAPKGIVFHHGTLEARLYRSSGPSERHQLRLTPLHFGGVTGSVARPIAYGWDLTLIPPRTFIARPGLWLREITESGVTDSGAPNFAFALATRVLMDPDREYDLSGWRTVGCGAGEGADLEVIEAFAEAAAPYGLRRDSLTTYYASTEAGRISAREAGSGLRVENLDPTEFRKGRATLASAEGMRSVSSGRPYPGIEVRVVDDDDRPLPERGVGEFHVKTKDLFDGYLGDRAATDAAFVDGWLRTGDLGYLAEGELFITGRKKDVIIVHGQNFHASDIEGIVQNQGIAGRSAAFAVRSGGSDVLVIAAEQDGEAEQVERRISTAVWKETGLSVKEVVLVRSGSLPTTDTGKLQRAKVRDLYESGGLDSAEKS